MANTETKTPIVYYGGKTAIMNHLLPLVPVHEIYSETFFGGGALFWSKEPAKSETINDTLDLVINFYRVLKTKFVQLKPFIESTLISRSIHSQALNLIRLHRHGLPIDSVQLAWAFWLCTNFAHMNKIGGGYKYANEQRALKKEFKKQNKR